MNLKNISISLIVFSTLALAAFVFAYTVANSTYEKESVRVYIPEDASEDSIKSILTDALGSDFGDKVALMWNIQRGNCHRAYGSYLVKEGDKAYRVARNIANGNQTPIRFTFNNIRRFGDLASRAGDTFAFDSLAFEQAADSVLGARGFDRCEYSAAIFPDTYEFYWTASPESVVSALNNYREKFWNEERRAKAQALNLTPNQIHTLASIVEEESNLADDRPRIARLYLNRLSRGMNLQADPTVKFQLNQFSLRRITVDHTRIDGPYNTYTRAGLPIGPIRFVEKATIDACLNAPKHDFLYMCARSDFSGYHDFAKDYATHRINAARYHRALNARGITSK